MSGVSRRARGFYERIRNVRLLVFDFDGVFTDNFVHMHEDGSESLRFWRSDGLGLKKLKTNGPALLVLSTERNPIVSARCRKLKLRCVQNVPDKWKVLQRILRQARLRPEQAAFVGNDINDLECLSRVGVPIIVRDAHPDVAQVARYRTRKKGGEGAVREVCDLFDKAWARR